jgi:DNA polymerase-3 subunit gamma/tau
MDVLEIDGASNNSVNDVRQIKDEVLFPPQAGRYKIYIIDEVHMLSGSAFNALLKTIEEPPPYIVFIFATTELHKVPATIKSRCQQFNFRLIPVETIQGILKKVCGEMGITAEDDALFWIARESTGSMRDAFTLFDQVVSFSAGSIRGDLIREKLGITGLEKLNALAEMCAANNAPGAFALTGEILDSGVSIEQFVIDLAGYYRSLLLLKNGITRESLLGYRPALFSSKALETFDSVRLEQALELLLDCYRDIRYSVSPRFELETAVSKLSWLGRWISPTELGEALESARGVFGNAGLVRQSQPAPATPTSHVMSSLTSTVRTSAVPSASVPRQSTGGGRSLSDEFNRMIAAKGSGASSNSDGISADDASVDDDVPLWDSAVSKKSGETENPSQVENVLSVIPGTVVE